MRCIRLLVADFVPSAPYESMCRQMDSERLDDANAKNKNYQRYATRFILFARLIQRIIETELSWLMVLSVHNFVLVS